MKSTSWFTCLLFCLGLHSITAQSQNTNYDKEILLIGSSYFNYNDLKSLIYGLAEGSGKSVYIEMCGQNGLYLSDHAQSPITEAKINERDWDYVILQGVGLLVAYPHHFTDHAVYPALQTLHDKISANCESTHMMFCLPWAFEDGMTWYQNWTDTYEDMQWHIYDTTLQYSNDIGFEIAPVGWAWYGVLEENNYPLHYLHQSDWNHPTLEGSYLMACVIYTAIFQESTVNNTYTAGITPDEVMLFQSVASDTVLNHLDLWNIPLLVNITEGTQEKIQKFINYPNPFSDKTTIYYQLDNEQRVNIVVFNSNGKKVKELLNRMQAPGDYLIEFDASGLAEGVYTCRMIADNSSYSIKMICNK